MIKRKRGCDVKLNGVSQEEKQQLSKIQNRYQNKIEREDEGEMI